MRWRALLSLFSIAVWVAPAYSGTLEPSRFPSLVTSVRDFGPLDFCGEKVPLDLEGIRERLEKEFLLSLWDRPQVLLWLKRSRRYLPPIEKILREGGVPDDLKFVAVSESALRPHAGSRKGAVGFWQFMAETGRKYGLVVDSRRDERRNLFASTRAAVRYFRDLYTEFGSWTLAAAAYNMGEEGLMAEILEQKSKDYYQLYLPLETQRFLFRVLSIKTIFSDPARYGFQLTEEDYYPPLAFDRVQVDCFQEIPLRIVAKAAGATFKVIKDLNPEIRGHHLAPGSHRILIPKGAAKGFQSRYKGLVKKFLEDRRERVYYVKEGDTLSEIAERFGVPLAALLIWNRLDLKRHIHPGDRLIIYPANLRNWGGSQGRSSP